MTVVPRPALAIVAAAVLTGIVLRAWVLLSDLGALDADEAVWGVMARHALEGELTAFFWGQAYGGTQEVLLTAAVFAVTGASVEALRVVPVLLFATACVVVWRIGIRTVGEPYARIGAAILWVWPAYLVWKSTRAHGFYGSGLVLGLLVVLLALRLADRRSRRDALLLGLTLGLGWWATPQVLVLAAPALVWLVWVRRSALRDAPLVLGAGVAGALPWIVSNLSHGWHSVALGPPGSTVVERLHNLTVATLPSALGARQPFTLDWVGGPLVGAALYGLLLAALAWGLSRCSGKLGPLLPIVAFFPFFYAISPYASLNTEPRYLVLLGPALALLVVCPAATRAGSSALLLALATVSAVGIGLLQRADFSFQPQGVRVPADLGPLRLLLDDAGVRHAYADYWLAWRLIFESGEQVIAVPTGTSRYEQRGHAVIPIDGERGRYPPFYHRVQGSSRIAYVFTSESQELRLQDLLRTAGYVRRRTGDFVVHLPPRR